ncbi:hypothetical protein [Methylocystis hirsuta]|nr:hypothetical protein [Methylocystis hirsuta]
MAALLAASPAFAHCFVGARFFPSTLAVHDPCVNDELSFIGGSGLGAAHGHGGGDGHGDGHGGGGSGATSPPRDYGIVGEWQKRITQDFAVSVESGWTRLHAIGGSRASGWHNFETSFQYQFLTAPEAEFVVKAGLSVEWGATGNRSVGAERFTSLTPMIYFGKGFGDLPDSVGFLRPFAVTGQFGYSVPTWRRTVTSTLHVEEEHHEEEHHEEEGGEQHIELHHEVGRNPYAFVWGGTVQYSLPYLKAQVIDLELPDFINRLTPLVEAKFAQPFTNTLTSGRQLVGTVNPGVIWTGQYFQLGAEAIIPINRASGKSVGWMLQLHFYLDDIFPTTIGRPIIQAVLPTTIGSPTSLSFQ